MPLTHLIPASASLVAWSRFLHQTRRFCDERGLVEVTTDYIVPAGAVEGTIDAIRVELAEGPAQLHTSPEIEMKRLLVSQPLAIYQVCKCFRDDPDTGVHRKEFTMLELYRPGTDYLDIQRDVQALLESLAGRSLACQRITVRELIRGASGIDLDETRDRASLSQAIEARKLFEPLPTESWEDLFFRLMIDYGEHALPDDRPIFICDYPTAVSVLSKSTSDPFWAERFEVYWQGLELCNGCTELTDATELRTRLERENALRSAENKAPHPVPERLLAALDAGLPDCAGVAIGLDRLFTCLQRPS